MKKVSYEGCCVLVAHQYLVARGQKGLVGPQGRLDIGSQDRIREIGNAIIKEFARKE